MYETILSVYKIKGIHSMSSLIVWCVVVLWLDNIKFA